jgi:hypothetical protein
VEDLPGTSVLVRVTHTDAARFEIRSFILRAGRGDWIILPQETKVIDEWDCYTVEKNPK